MNYKNDEEIKKHKIICYVNDQEFDDLNRMSDLDEMSRSKFMNVVINYYIDNHYEYYRDLLLKKVFNGWYDENGLSEEKKEKIRKQKREIATRYRNKKKK